MDNDWSALDWTAIVLAIVGALNWGLIGIGGLIETNLNVVNLLLGSMPLIEYTIYLLIGLAGLYLIYFTTKEGDL